MTAGLRLGAGAADGGWEPHDPRGRPAVPQLLYKTLSRLSLPPPSPWIPLRISPPPHGTNAAPTLPPGGAGVRAAAVGGSARAALQAAAWRPRRAFPSARALRRGDLCGPRALRPDALPPARCPATSSRPSLYRGVRSVRRGPRERERTGRRESSEGAAETRRSASARRPANPPETHPPPEADGAAPVFYKGGEAVKHALMPFGGGTTLCPGRHFARREIAQAASAPVRAAPRAPVIHVSKTARARHGSRGREPAPHPEACLTPLGRPEAGRRSSCMPSRRSSCGSRRARTARRRPCLRSTPPASGEPPFSSPPRPLASTSPTAAL
jgi:hypothetical protein